MEEEQEVKLLSSWASQYGMRVEFALKAKDIRYKFVGEDLSNKSELLLSSNPVYKKVPVLIHNGTPICESGFIIEYIDEIWPTPPPLLPSAPYDRYLLRFWSDFVDKKWMKIMGPMFSAKSAEERSGMWEKAQEEYAQMAITIERAVTGLGKRGLLYVEGKNCLKYMDVCFVPFMAWFGSIEKLFGLRLPDSKKCPCLHVWIQNLLTNEVVKSTLSNFEKLMEAAGMVTGRDDKSANLT